ncbi:MAG: DUF1700 domain-containing protein [Ruminococcaceae bacterium]|nr:DUF1700 domain-containing protein [Oscillospiraceae bacterium]
MTKMEFIAEMAAALRDLSKNDIARLLEYYGEMVDERVEDGMSESEAVAALGSVEDIAAQIMKDIPRERREAGVLRSGMDKTLDAAERGMDKAIDAADKGIDALSREMNALGDRMDELGREIGKKYGSGSVEFRDEDESEDRGEYHIDEPFDALDVRVGMADVRVLGTRGGETRIETEHDENVEETVEVCDGVLTVILGEPHGQRTGIGAILGALGGGFGGGEVTIYLSDKQWDTVHITTLSGDVEVQDFKARAVTLSTKSGDVDARHLEAEERVDADSLSGDVRFATMQAGDVTMRSLSGNLEMNYLRAGNLSAKGKSGDIEIEDTIVDGMMSAETTSGDVALRRSDAQELRLVSVSGDVSGTLLSPKTFYAHSISGDVRVPESDAGAGRCDARTTSGDVSLRIAP